MFEDFLMVLLIPTAIVFGIIFVPKILGERAEHETLMSQGPPCEYGTHPERIGYTFDTKDHGWNPVFNCVPDNRTNA